MDAWDILVVGAGPAGCSAAWNAAKNDLSTLLIEEHPTVGEPVHCGECLSETAANRLPKELPHETISRHVDGIRIIFPEGVKRLVTEPGYVLEKHIFEQWMAKEAQAEGATLTYNRKLTSLTRDGNTWAAEVGDSTEHAKIIIDASGVASITSKLLNLNPPQKTVIGVQYELNDIPHDDYIDFYLWSRLAPHGYLWVIPKSGDRANVGLVTDDNKNAKKNLNTFNEEIGVADKEKTKTFGGFIPAGGPLPNTTGDGIILVGDAAGFTSPMFEGGTALSIKSGEFAATTAAEAIKEGDTRKKTAHPLHHPMAQ